MASIFNKKQDVLDVVLTTKGRELYSKGKLKPSYYRFYDENIIYDATDAELQNETYDRIKNSLYEKPITSEGAFLESGGNKGGDISMLHNELAKYDSLSQAAPAWQILFDDATYDTDSFSKFPNEVVNFDRPKSFSTSATVEGINTYEERIPQFNMNVELKYHSLDDGTSVSLYEDEQNRDIFLNIKENNSFLPTERQDLEIEVFKIVQDINENNWMRYGVSDDLKASLKNLEFNDEETNSNTVENFLNVLFDSLAVQQNNLKVKNIYTGVVDDPDLCED
jgi:hypothetical protein